MTKRWTSQLLVLSLSATITACIEPPTGSSAQNNATAGNNTTTADMSPDKDMAQPEDMPAPEDLGAADMNIPVEDMSVDMLSPEDMTSAPCGGRCEGETPVCNLNNNRCVGCLDNDHCGEDTPFCSTNTNTCVECQDSTQCAGSDLPFCHVSDFVCVECQTNDACQRIDASFCDESGTCSECSVADDCTHLTIDGKDLKQCVGGVCMECTAETAEDDCDGNACLPNNKCSNTPLESVETCMPCEADGECALDHRCVPMMFGDPPVMHGDYCLKLASADCVRPYIQFAGPTSVSGEPPTQYCGVDQATTTCEAVLDMINEKPCGSRDECGNSNLEDGGCNGVCTITCDAPAHGDDQCPSNKRCSVTFDICDDPIVP